MRHGLLVFGLGLSVALGAGLYGCGSSDSGSSPDGGSSSAAGSGTAGRGGSGTPGTGGSTPGTGGSTPGTGGAAAGAPGAGGAAAGSPGTAGAGGATESRDGGGTDANGILCPANPMGKACTMNQFCTTACTNGMREMCGCQNGMFACQTRQCQMQNADAGIIRRDGGVAFQMCAAGAMDGSMCTRQQGQLNACEVAACVDGRHTICTCGNNNRYACDTTRFGCP